MKLALAPLLSLPLVCFPLLALAQSDAPARPPAESRRAPLNLKLDEAARPSAPRITFGAPAPAGEAREEKGLPGLGGTPSRAFENLPVPAGERGSPFPPDTERGAR